MKKVILSLSLLALAACQSAPSNIIIQPNYTAVGSQLQGKQFDVNVSDVRSSDSALKVISKDGTTTVPSNNLSLSLQKTLVNALKRHGANTDTQTNTQLELKIHQLEAIVKQETLKYRSESIIELEVIINQGSRRFAKYYNGNQQSEGPLLHDKARIESDLNTLLEQLISRMVTDQELKQFLQG